VTPLETLARYPAHDGTVAGLLASRAVVDPARPFLLFGATTWSWAGFMAAVERAAAGLAARGIGAGDRVALLAPSCDAALVLFCAAARLGAVFVPINPDATVDEARYVLGHAEPAAVAATPATSAVAQAAGARGLFALDDLGGDGPVPPARGRADDVCAILYTSGTTGFPKGVMHVQRSWVLAGEGFVERLHLQPDDRLLCILPLFHINALFYSFGGAVAAGASLVVAPRFSASGFWKLAAASGATCVNLIAAVGSILARRPRSEYVAGHRLRKIYGAATPPEVAALFQRELGATHVIEGYGMTEIPGACNVAFDGPHKPGSIGRAARHPDPRVRFAELRIDGDADEGELLVRTPIAMTGYWRDPEATAAAFTDGWFATGDLVRRDADGDLFFVARQKDVIRRRGENVSGAELDRVLGAHPGVAEAAAIPVPSELGEDEILAAVVARPGAAVSAADLRAWCAARLAPAKLPRYVAFVDELPHTPTHRVAKFKLRQEPGLLLRAVDLEGGR
jgi:crotonobetaine/carnitine-CoA ligase